MKHSQQELLKLLKYDPLTGVLTWRLRPLSMFPTERSHKTWNTRYADKQAFTSINAHGYHVGGIDNKIYRANRVIFKMLYNLEPENVDHEDGDSLNDRKYNLRAATHAINQQNTKKRSTNTSGVVGVIWNKHKNAWDARIGYQSKTINLGRFKLFDDAVKERKDAEIRYGYHPNHGR